MKSSLPKALQFLAGKSMLEHVRHATLPLTADQTVVVCAPGAQERIQKTNTASGEGVICVQQEGAFGTGHALKLSLIHI